MKQSAINGRNFSIRVFASVLLISLYVIIRYQMNPELQDAKKFVQQIIRFSLTVLIMYFVFKGKEWSVSVLTLLFAGGIAVAFMSMFGPSSFTLKIPFIVMLMIYSIGIYHLNFSKNFKDYFSHLKNQR